MKIQLYERQLKDEREPSGRRRRQAADCAEAGEWGEWTACSASFGVQSLRTRTRTVPDVPACAGTRTLDFGSCFTQQFQDVSFLLKLYSGPH